MMAAARSNKRTVAVCNTSPISLGANATAALACGALQNDAEFEAEQHRVPIDIRQVPGGVLCVALPPVRRRLASPPAVMNSLGSTGSSAGQVPRREHPAEVE